MFKNLNLAALGHLRTPKRNHRTDALSRLQRARSRPGRVRQPGAGHRAAACQAVDRQRPAEDRQRAARARLGLRQRRPSTPSWRSSPARFSWPSRSAARGPSSTSIRPAICVPTTKISSCIAAATASWPRCSAAMGSSWGSGFWRRWPSADDRVYSFIQTTDAFLMLFKSISSPNVGVALDLWHWHFGGGTLDQIRAITPAKVATLALADADPETTAANADGAIRRLPGATGVIDSAAVLALLADGQIRRAGHRGPFAGRLRRAIPRTDRQANGRSSGRRLESGRFAASAGRHGQPGVRRPGSLLTPGSILFAAGPAYPRLGEERPQRCSITIVG